jgi:hypothetical protein
MRKGIVRLIVSLFYSFLGLSLLILIGCGDTSGDPTATITLTAASEEVPPEGSTVITATVIKAVGQKTEATETGPAFGENVTFTLQTANGGSLSSPTQKTNSSGVAKTVYTAGDNYYSDIIKATLDNGTYDVLIIGKTVPTPPTPTPVTPLSIEVAAAPTSVSAGNNSLVTATLTGDGNAGVTVTFTLSVDKSGATLPPSAVTDGSGNAQVYYTAGSNDPTNEVQDIVQATVGSISSSVVITRTVP